MGGAGDGMAKDTVGGAAFMRKRKSGKAANRKSQPLKKVSRVRQNFPEAWVWTETQIKYLLDTQN